MKSPLVRHNQAGFTLLEIMMVVGIIVIILGVAVGRMGNIPGMVKGEVAVKSDLQSITTNLQLYSSMNGFYPTTEPGLEALVIAPQSDPKPSRWYQLFKDVPKDPWGSKYIYLSPGRKNPDTFDVYSAGQDRKADTADDNWGS